MRALQISLTLLLLASFTAATPYTVDTLPPEQPAEPTDVKAPPPALCFGESGPVPVSPDFIPTCNPVRDGWCWDWCGEIKASFSDVYHKNGQKWAEHWMACLNTVIDERVLREQAESALAVCNAYRAATSKSKKKGKK